MASYYDLPCQLQWHWHVMKLQWSTQKGLRLCAKNYNLQGCTLACSHHFYMKDILPITLRTRTIGLPLKDLADYSPTHSMLHTYCSSFRSCYKWPTLICTRSSNRKPCKTRPAVVYDHKIRHLLAPCVNLSEIASSMTLLSLHNLLLNGHFNTPSIEQMLCYNAHRGSHLQCRSTILCNFLMFALNQPSPGHLSTLASIHPNPSMWAFQGSPHLPAQCSSPAKLLDSIHLPRNDRNLKSPSSWGLQSDKVQHFLPENHKTWINNTRPTGHFTFSRPTNHKQPRTLNEHQRTPTHRYCVAESNCSTV